MGFRVRFKAFPEEVWKPITQIGGETGWYYGKILWKIRGWFDRLIGGSGSGGEDATRLNYCPEMPLIFGGYWK